MFYIADLHIHSHYSRATSKNLNLESLYQWARVKGINVVGTGDFTHPFWFKELQEKLEPDGTGLFKLRNPPKDPAIPGIKVHDIEVRFCLTSEISSIYKYGDKVRKNHNLLYAPDFDTVARINAKLDAIGNLKADGRPILGLPARDLLDITLNTSERAYLIPAHVWTPWFSMLGSKSGYDSVKECFRDLADHIFALETGLSSDPEMNWRLSALDNYTLISNSDAHSPQKLGREANLLDTELSYDGLFDAIKTRQGFLGTYEFFPEEGKYHLDGHRKCNISLEPEETLKYNGLCPSCKQPLTVGVLHRVEKLADRDQPERPRNAADFHYIIPLPEIISEIQGVGPASKAVQHAFQQVISAMLCYHLLSRHRFSNKMASL
ncbi:MAG: endonuclease Q family protein [Gammaproteobacteria bacterium]|nr:endonuclease Q family protein [Gammaproteobacteria bacterium]